MLMSVDRFLVEKYPRDHFDFAALAVGDITTFVRRQATELSSVQAKHLVTAANLALREDALKKTSPLNATVGRLKPDDQLLSFLRNL